MTTIGEDQAIAAVAAAKLALENALKVLRDVRGEPADHLCDRCEGTGRSAFNLGTDDDQDCFRCKGVGRVPNQFPWVVTQMTWEGKALRPSLFNAQTTWVSVRPCAAEAQGKTYLGWLLGDLALGQIAQLGKDGTLAVSMAGHNPAIFVPALGRVVYGCESWWRRLETPEDVRQITDTDINNVWYVQALKDLASPQPPSGSEDDGVAPARRQPNQ